MTCPPVHPPRAPPWLLGSHTAGPDPDSPGNQGRRLQHHTPACTWPRAPPHQCRELPANRSAGCPPQTPHLLSLRAAGGRGVAPGRSSSPRRAPRGSAGVRCAPGASTRMGRCRPPSCWPHPRPAPGPTRPGEKALIGKNHPGTGRGGGGDPRGRAVSSGARAAGDAPPPTPVEMSSPSADGEGRPGGSAEPTSQPSSKGHLLQGAAQSCAASPPLPQA